MPPVELYPTVPPCANRDHQPQCGDQSRPPTPSGGPSCERGSIGIGRVGRDDLASRHSLTASATYFPSREAAAGSSHGREPAGFRVTVALLLMGQTVEYSGGTGLLHFLRLGAVNFKSGGFSRSFQVPLAAHPHRIL